MAFKNLLNYFLRMTQNNLSTLFYLGVSGEGYNFADISFTLAWSAKICFSHTFVEMAAKTPINLLTLVYLGVSGGYYTWGQICPHYLSQKQNRIRT